MAREEIRRELAAERLVQLSTPRVWGPPERAHIASTAVLNDALLNTVSGTIVVGDHAFMGHDVALVTGSHDVHQVGRQRQLAIPAAERDIIIGDGAWIASRATVLGPCRVGANAVVAAGSVVSADVPREAIVAGAPARLIGRVGAPSDLPATVRVATEAGIIAAHQDDRVVTPYLREYGTWAEDECRLLASGLKPGGAVVDVGANIGYMTLVAAKAVGSTGTVIAVEPHPANLALLRANIASNGVADRVRVVGAAAWDREGMVELYECADNTGDHRIETLQGDRKVISVNAVRLDDIVPHGLRIDMIKLDTQATEHRVLQGAATLLKRDRPVVLCEFWPRGIRERGEDPVAVLAGFRCLDYDIDLPDAPQAADLDDRAIVNSVHARSDGPHGGFATLRLSPRLPGRVVPCGDATSERSVGRDPA